ncbi:MAG TPA: phosphatase PAP2 family protein [Polyangiaceae bacterium]|nr:phosphatase PAP2 family protein [Polyangiaceae bacterium]
MSFSFVPHTFCSSSFAIATCAVLLGSSVFLAERPAFAEPPAVSTAPATSDASPAATGAAPAVPVAPGAPVAPAAPGASTPVPVAPLLPGYVPTLVSVDTPPPLVWKWPRFSTANYLITGAGGAVTLAAAIVHPRAQHSLSGGVWFDEGVRNALRVDTLPNRYIFRDASDVGLSLMVSWPFVADALTTAWWYRGSRETAQELALIDLETLAVSGAIQGMTNVLVSRERPYGRDCGSKELPSDSIDCANAIHYRSFFSGHSSFSFTSAALICIHHFKNELLGAPWDALSCAGGYALATTTATFRVVSDVHYASDVLTGALMGTLVGYGVPLLHYSRRGSSTTTVAGTQLHLIPSPGGIGLLGIF